jgi:glucans biosynthesis protein C
MSPTATSSLAARRYDLDWLRVIAFALLIFYHVGMFYVTWDWHVKSVHAGPALEPAMALINPWRLALLFFISGVALRFAMDKAQLRSFLPRRTLRLLLPLAFGMFVIVVPQAYFELLRKGEIGPDFWAFYRTYLSFAADFSIIVPTWNHLWYLAYILVYTLALAALLPLLRWAERLCDDDAFAWVGAGRSWRLLLILPLPFIIYDALLGDRFPETHALIDDWANHAASFTVLLYGWWAAKSPAFWRAVERSLPAAISLALTLGLLLLAARLSGQLRGGPVAEVMGVVRIVYAWAVIVSLVGLAQRYLNRNSARLSYLTEAIFPYYILHQTLIVVIGATLTAWRLPLWAEASLVAGGTVIGCIALTEVIRRVGVLRPLFGMNPNPPQPRRTVTLNTGSFRRLSPAPYEDTQ